MNKKARFKKIMLTAMTMFSMLAIAMAQPVQGIKNIVIVHGAF